MANIERCGSGTPLVLVHGFLGSAAMWRPLADRLRRRFDVISIDLPGFGQDGASQAPSSIESFSRFVLATVHDLGIRRFHLAGHSMGGMIAQQLALDHGDRIDRLVLYGTAASGRLPHRFESIAATIERVGRDGAQAVGQGIVRSWFVSAKRGSGLSGCLESIAGVTNESAVAALTAIAQWDVRERLGALTMPCLIVGGDSDRSTPPEELFALRARLPHAQLCVVPRCAHAAHLERRDLFATVMRRFLTEPMHGSIESG